MVFGQGWLYCPDSLEYEQCNHKIVSNIAGWNSLSRWCWHSHFPGTWSEAFLHGSIWNHALECAVQCSISSLRNAKNGIPRFTIEHVSKNAMFPYFELSTQYMTPTCVSKWINRMLSSCPIFCMIKTWIYSYCPTSNSYRGSMGFFHKSGIIRLEVCVVLHNYAIQFLLVSKYRHAMQSRYPDRDGQRTRVSVSNYIINLYNI